jgi:hypothetical protein
MTEQLRLRVLPLVSSVIEDKEKAS